jgi:hypothetical protein
MRRGRESLLVEMMRVSVRGVIHSIQGAGNEIVVARDGDLVS